MEKPPDILSETQMILKKLKKFLKILKNFEEKLKKSWKYSIFGKSIYPGCLNYGEKKPGLDMFNTFQENCTDIIYP